MSNNGDSGNGDQSAAAAAAEEVKVDKWDGNAVKNSLDDAVKKTFTDTDRKLKYRENHSLVDTRLAICVTAVGAAMFALVWDYMRPFPESRPVLILCVIGYFVLMSILTAYTTLVEKGIFLRAVQTDANGATKLWTLSSMLKRFDDIYHLCIEYKAPNGRVAEANLSKSIANWFDTDGTLLYDKFESEVLKLHDSLLSDKKNK
ncbi:signal peptidase complex subunit 2-like [Oppia nitens]|uniref:signal peptidase complex subunit 2-like n=1 Tax=Oppia nitens TaxID=1686743 RepID=UPI0023DA96D9|nr:signal peptidase complex subunit 2-like [Oppia nitens]